MIRHPYPLGRHRDALGVAEPLDLGLQLAGLDPKPVTTWMAPAASIVAVTSFVSGSIREYPSSPPIHTYCSSAHASVGVPTSGMVASTGASRGAGRFVVTMGVERRAAVARAGSVTADAGDSLVSTAPQATKLMAVPAPTANSHRRRNGALMRCLRTDPSRSYVAAGSAERVTPVPTSIDLWALIGVESEAEGATHAPPAAGEASCHRPMGRSFARRISGWSASGTSRGASRS